MIKFNVKLKKNENIIKINLKYCVIINIQAQSIYVKEKRLTCCIFHDVTIRFQQTHVLQTVKETFHTILQILTRLNRNCEN